MLKNCFLIVFLLVLTKVSSGQNLQKMQIWQDSLTNLGKAIYAHKSDVERLESNFLFVKTLVSALKETNSYFFNFEQLNMISAVRSPDDSFRVFSWNIPLQDGSFLFYGSIQFKSGTLKLLPLLDKTFEISDVNKNIVDSKNWYGAQYYDIIALKPNQYLLLGWKGHNASVSQKVIEVLSLDSSGNVKLGQGIFDDDSTIVRKIFSYAKDATMLLRFNKQENRIEFDHLIPLDGGKKDQNVPDLSHDAYKLKNNKLELLKNITILNLEN